MSQEAIAGIWNFNPDFPELPEQLIERPHLLQTIADILGGDTPVLFLEGADGDGATTTLAQFCQAYPEQAFSLFIRPASRFAYSMEYLRFALAEQFHWYVYGERLSEPSMSESEFNALRMKALAKDRGKTLYFVVDGLHQIPLEDRRMIPAIMTQLLPTGIARCRLILTGQQNGLGQFLHASVRSKPYQLLKLKLDECKTFLAGTGLHDDEYFKVYELCKRGSPGRLAVVRRLLASGMSLPQILENDPAQYLEFIQLEFKVLADFDHTENMIIAAIAFSKMSITIKDLSLMINIDGDVVEKIIQRCQFLTKPQSGQVEFISETHRQYALRKLDALKNAALAAQLEYLQKNPRSGASLRFLPVYFEMLGKQEALIDLLSRDYYGDLLESTQSFSTLRASAELGAKSAASLHRIHEVFKFSVQRSLFSSVSNVQGSSARIRALVSLGRVDTALALASAEATKEDRLGLLSAFARRLFERNGNISPELLEYVSNLMSEMDFSALGDMALEIAADVLIFDPDAAIGIIDSALKGATAAVKDAAFAELSFSASMAQIKNNKKIESKASERISDESLQRIAHSFELIAERLDAAELSRTIAGMPAAHRIYFLRSLVSLKKRDSSVLDLVELGLDTIIKESEYTPRTKDLAELCSPFMEEISDTARLRHLVARFDSQLGLVAKSSHSKELTTLQMRLAAAEHQYDRALARDRIEQTYFDVESIKSPEIQMECAAIMLSALSKIDRDNSLEDRDGFKAMIRADLSRTIDAVLKDTADHLSTISPVLKVLAVDDCEATLELAAKLNTESRRDRALEMVANVLAAQAFTQRRFESLEKALRSIVNDEIRSRATLALLSAVDPNPSKNEWLTSLEAIRRHLTRAEQLGRWDAWMFKAYASAKLTYKVDLLEARCREAAAMTSSQLVESELYFRISEALAESQPQLAQTYYENGERVAGTTPFSTVSASRMFELCTSLVARAIAPLARTNQIDDEKLERVVALVGYLPGVIARVRVFNDLAERMWCAKRPDIANRIVQEEIRALLEEARLTNQATWKASLRVAFPSLCAAHLGMTLPQLNELSTEDADAALLDAAMLRLRHLPGQEPESNGRFDHTRLDQADVLDVIQMLGHVRSDSALFYILKPMVAAISDKLNRTRFTAQQRADWAAKLKSIVEIKLPDPRNIRHNGFKIVCTAQVYALTDVPWTNWEQLEQETEQVENCADRGFIFTSLATALPSRFSFHRKRLLERALEEINRIPSLLDRLSHLQGYAEQAHANDAATSAKECIKAAMKLALEIDDYSRTAEHRRVLIDFADQVDPGLADELIELVDDDPARIALKAEAKQAAAIAKTKRLLADARQSKEAVDFNLDNLAVAAWRNLGALEAGRLEVKPLEVITQYVTMAGSGTLHEAYPVLSWHLANMDRKFVHAQDVTAHVAPVAEALLLSAELIYSILSKVSGRTPRVREDDQARGMLVRRKTRQEALLFIEQWLQNKARNQITYCDAYFSSKDVPLLRLCLGRAPSCKVYVIASKSHLHDAGELSEEPFIKAWKEQSDQSPPETEVIAIAYADAPKKHVLHDRWLLTDGGGLRLGTSFNSLGEEKLSELSEMDPTRATAVLEQINKYRTRSRVVDGARIQYTSFTL